MTSEQVGMSQGLQLLLFIRYFVLEYNVSGCIFSEG